MYPAAAACMSNYPFQLIPFFRQLLISVKGIHGLDISHEDLKRSNVLATDNLEPVLVDFGFAHFTPHRGSVRSLGGTMDYSSPEKLSVSSKIPCSSSMREDTMSSYKQDKQYNPYSNDIWSLGILFLKLLGFHNPYRIKPDETENDFKHKLINTDADWSFLGKYDGPGRIGQVLRGMLERRPAKRWTVSFSAFVSYRFIFH
jgi:serine/threonine protein kinase